MLGRCTPRALLQEDYYSCIGLGWTDPHRGESRPILPLNSSDGRSAHSHVPPVSANTFFREGKAKGSYDCCGWQVLRLVTIVTQALEGAEQQKTFCLTRQFWFSAHLPTILPLAPTSFFFVPHSGRGGGWTDPHRGESRLILPLSSSDGRSAHSHVPPVSANSFGRERPRVRTIVAGGRYCY